MHIESQQTSCTPEHNRQSKLLLELCQYLGHFLRKPVAVVVVGTGEAVSGIVIGARNEPAQPLVAIGGGVQKPWFARSHVPLLGVTKSHYDLLRALMRDRVMVAIIKAAAPGRLWVLLLPPFPKRLVIVAGC